jgi:hypothetical protein
MKRIGPNPAHPTHVSTELARARARIPLYMETPTILNNQRRAHGTNPLVTDINTETLPFSDLRKLRSPTRSGRAPGSGRMSSLPTTLPDGNKHTRSIHYTTVDL